MHRGVAKSMGQAECKIKIDIKKNKLWEFGVDLSGSEKG